MHGRTIEEVQQNKAGLGSPKGAVSTVYALNQEANATHKNRVI